MSKITKIDYLESSTTLLYEMFFKVENPHLLTIHYHNKDGFSYLDSLYLTPLQSDVLGKYYYCPDCSSINLDTLLNNLYQIESLEEFISEFKLQ